MRIVVLKDVDAVANYGAEFMTKRIKEKPNLTLGLATGSSPIRLYQTLISLYNNKQVSFADVTTFNLDEYLGLEGSHPQSYRFFMNDHFFNHVDVNKDNTFVPQGDSQNPMETCTGYEALIQQRGGIDLQLLGIGRNGHIGFNEPSSSLSSRTRVKTLTKDTVDANRVFFKKGEFQPHLAITMGIGTIMESNEVLLIATGKEKADAVKGMIEGAVSARCPASMLQMHSNVRVVVDQEAASALEDVAFYDYIEQEQQRLINAVSAR